MKASDSGAYIMSIQECLGIVLINVTENDKDEKIVIFSYVTK